MSEIDIRVTGRAGRITLTRPKALNALTYDMCLGIETALRNWREDDAVDLVIFDAAGDKAFCAGGDIAKLYETGKAGNYDFGHQFWRDEYRLNAYLKEYPKPTVSFMQGFTMGGGVGIGCHCAHRVVGESSQIAMPECGIGLVPDVGGTFILANAPGKLGVYLGLTAGRMQAGDAVLAGFADVFIPEETWADLIELLEASGDAGLVERHAETLPASSLQANSELIDRHFGGRTLGDILDSLRGDDGAFVQKALSAVQRNSPLSMACALDLQRLMAQGPNTIRTALELEFRYIWRAMEHGDFLEGIRAQIIDKDRNPQWQFADGDVPKAAVDRMLAPLGADAMVFEEDKA